MTISNLTTKFVNEIMDGFQANRGKGSCYCLNPIKPYYLIACCIERYLNKHNNDKILVVVEHYNVKQYILKELSQLNIECRDKINFISSEFVNIKYNYNYDFIITCELTEYTKIHKLHCCSKFTLSIFTEVITNQKLILSIRELLPNITTSVNAKEAHMALIYLPVEEHHVGVDLIDEDKDKYKKCTDYINQCVKIFDNLANIEKCKKGDPVLNISASEFRTTLAYNNGWNETLDTSIPLFKQIDEIYNPNILFERACNFYNIISERSNILTNNKNKIDKIVELCKNHNDKRILIVSKKGEFAAAITNKLNDEGLFCLDYHDCIEDAMLVDDNGIPVLYKTGANKGKPRIIKASAISSRNLVEFNKNTANILSIKYSSDVKLQTNVDIIIITDGLYDNITEIRTRYNLIEFNENPTICYRLYTKDTIEQTKLSQYTPTNNITIIKENNEINYDEDSGVVII